MYLKHHQLFDTFRKVGNGRGFTAEWCNRAGMKIGTLPSTLNMCDE